MQSLSRFFLAITLICTFTSCRDYAENRENTVIKKNGSASNDSPFNQVTLSDSMPILDSLILKNRTNKIEESLTYALHAVKMAKRLNTPLAFTNAYIMLGNAYSQFKLDSAFYFYNTARELVDSLNLKTLRGKVLYNLAMLYGLAGNNKTSIILLDSALNASKGCGNFVIESNALNAIGNIYLDMGDETKARIMYDSAFRVAASHSLYLQMGTAMGNLAKFETDQMKSQNLNQRAIGYMQHCTGSEEPIAQILINMANGCTDQDSAIYYFEKALTLISDENSPEEYMGVYNNLACTYLDMGEIAKAEKCILDHAVPVAVRTNNIDWQSTIYDTYADILQRKGNLAGALFYEKRSIESMELANNQSALKQVRLIAAMLDLKNKESVIKESKIEIERSRSLLRSRNQWIIIILLFLAAVSTTFVVLILRKRIQLQKQQIESAKKLIEAEENERARIGRDLHDLTGQRFSGLTGYIGSIEFHDLQTKTTVLQMVEETQGLVRKISHQMNKSWIERFAIEKSIAGLCEDFRKMTRLILEYHAPDQFPDLSRDVKIHLFRILQELLSNAVKHAPMAKIYLEIYFTAGQLNIMYNDDGPGFSNMETKHHGIGLSNISERIKLLNGQLVFESYPGFGTDFKITIPIGNKKSTKLELTSTV